MRDNISEDIYYKVDLRVRFTHKNQTFNVSTGEFAKKCNMAKLRNDHDKIILEGRSIAAKMQEIGAPHPKVYLLQGAGKYLLLTVDGTSCFIKAIFFLFRP